jgi:hypothetical protein
LCDPKSVSVITAPDSEEFVLLRSWSLLRRQFKSVSLAAGAEMVSGIRVTVEFGAVVAEALIFVSSVFSRLVVSAYADAVAPTVMQNIEIHNLDNMVPTPPQL